MVVVMDQEAMPPVPSRNPMPEAPAKHISFTEAAKIVPKPILKQPSKATMSQMDPAMKRKFDCIAAIEKALADLKVEVNNTPPTSTPQAQRKRPSTPTPQQLSPTTKK